jgi:hypothetical protein
MSLLNHRLMEECEKLSQSQSFSDAEQRHTFEQAIVENGSASMLFISES